MTHLSEDERLVLIEAEAEPAHPHLESCGLCRTEILRMRALLRDARAAEVPEPSPLFWDGFSRRVRDAVSSSGPSAGRGGWPFWRVLVPLTAAVGALVVAVSVARDPRIAPPAAEPAAVSADRAGSDRLAGDDDEQWAVLSAIAADFDLETLSDCLGRPAAGGVEGVLWQLSDEEMAGLGALLRAEMQQQP